MVWQRPPAGPLLRQLNRLLHNDQIVLSGCALVVGVVVAYGAIAFRLAIGAVQGVFFGFTAEQVMTLAGQLPWWRVVVAPAAGGLLVGIMLHLLMPRRLPQAVASVIEASALKDGRIGGREGLAAALISATSLGVGASAGREGPVVHLGAAIASVFARRLHLNRSITMTLLGCGVASAVAASFNAPIAGVFFALEVVIGHYALHAFAPIVLASVIGTIVSRIHLGNFPAFSIPGYDIVSFWEFPAFGLLGLVAAAVAMLFMWSIMVADTAVSRLRGVPDVLVPAAGGLAVGIIAVPFPHVLGVGYETTDAALNEEFSLWLLLALIVLKTTATAISLGCRFGGGVFSPSLCVGALTGGAFGIIAAGIFPAFAASQGLYAIVGMGAVAAAVLGAPVSTILIVFELTGDYRVTTAVMVAVAVASVTTQQVLGRSFFQWQLRRKGIDLAGGRAVGRLVQRQVRELMSGDMQAIGADTDVSRLHDLLHTARHGDFLVVDGDGRLVGTLTFADLGASPSGDRAVTAGGIARRNAVVLEAEDTVETALRLMETAAEEHVPVVTDRQTMRLIGVVNFKDVLLAYNRALLQERAEERGER